MSRASIADDVARYYTGKVRSFGPTFKGVDWSSKESQELRFDQLLKVCPGRGRFSVNDYGCGYGALFPFLRKRCPMARYCGYDISREMIAAARTRHRGQAGCRFVSSEAALRKADFTLASGIFGVKLDHGDSEWRAYALSVISKMARLSRAGFAFNMLTKYSDRDRMRDDLYYADPAFFFDHCKRAFSRNVALLHDYGLYEFTMIVRLSPGA